MQSNNMMVSIIMPVYNSENFLAEAIESVTCQSYSDWELIIINDASTDNSQTIVDEFKDKDKRIKVICSPVNSGVAQTRNIGIESAKGRFIAFLDSDDLWNIDKLSIQIEMMVNKKVIFSYSSYHIINEEGKRLQTYIIPYTQASYYQMLKGSIIGNSTVIYDCHKIGKQFLPEVKHEDYALWLNILKQVDCAEGILIPMSSYRKVEGSISANKLKVFGWYWHIFRKQEKIGLIKSLYYIANVICCGVKKTYLN